MDPQFLIDVLSRILHVSTAIILVGGSVFTLLVLQPSARELEGIHHDRFAEGVRRRWKPVVHTGILLFLVTGLYNYVRAIDSHRGDSLYHALLGTKMLLALAIFFIASALVGRSPALQRLRDSRRQWTAVVVILAAVIVAISGFVKVRSSPTAFPAVPVVHPEN